MKKMLLLAGVLVLAACGDRNADAPAGDASGEMAPAGGAMDSSAMMHDSAMMGSDTMMMRDTAR